MKELDVSSSSAHYSTTMINNVQMEGAYVMVIEHVTCMYSTLLHCSSIAHQFAIKFLIYRSISPNTFTIQHTYHTNSYSILFIYTYIALIFCESAVWRNFTILFSHKVDKIATGCSYKTLKLWIVYCLMDISKIHENHKNFVLSTKELAWQ